MDKKVDLFLGILLLIFLANHDTVIQKRIVNWVMVNNAYLIDHCPVIRELTGLNAERTGWWLGNKE